MLTCPHGTLAVLSFFSASARVMPLRYPLMIGSRKSMFSNRVVALQVGLLHYDAEPPPMDVVGTVQRQIAVLCLEGAARLILSTPLPL